MFKKVIFSFLSGILIFIVTWLYHNHEYTLSLDDAFAGKVSFWRNKVFTVAPTVTDSFIFINTGKDLALIEDTLDYGNITVSDREKIYNLLHYINQATLKPIYTVIDIEFYYHYTNNPPIDSLIQNEINANPNTIIPILKNNSGHYIRPLINTNYGYAHYTTYGSKFNKFQFIDNDSIPSIPMALQLAIHQPSYKYNALYTTCNNKLSWSSIWPSYYISEYELKANKIRYAQYYNLGEILLGLQSDSTKTNTYFANKIIMIGNFEQDQHNTAVGSMPGTLLLANIYLSLLNNEHIVNGWWVMMMIVALSFLSYFAWFSKMPEIQLKFSFVFSKPIANFIKRYISYFGCMFLLSILSVLVIKVQPSLFLPALLFTVIEYFRQKKYEAEK